MAKNHRSPYRAPHAVTKLRTHPVHTYTVYAYRPGSPDPETAHIHCGNCGEDYSAESVPFGPLRACEECGEGLLHRDWVAAEKPVMLINKQTRNQWIDEKIVTSHSRGAVLRFRLLLPPKPQVSITTSGISDGVAMGRAGARAVLAAYTPCDRVGIPRWEAFGAEG